MNILGISCYYHDSAAALIKNNEIVALSEEERFSRIKHDSGFPVHAVNFVLQQGKISVNDLDCVVFYEKPFLKFERLVKTIFNEYPKSAGVFRESMVSWLLDKMWIKNHIKDNLKIPAEKIMFCEHHYSHAAASYLCSPFNESAIVTIDGVGEWATATVGVGRGNEIKILKEIHFPHSLGLLYSAFTAFLGFEVNEGEYKVMGMASYGKPKYIDQVKKTVSYYPDGSFELNLDYFSFQHSTVNTFNKKFESLFGEPRNSEWKFFTKDTPYPSYFGEKPANYAELCGRNQYYADVAASIQAVLEEILINLCNVAYKEIKSENLCLSGGVALNCTANWKIMQNTPFKNAFIQPAASDAGGALGAALYAYYTITGDKNRCVMNHASWGKEYTESDIKQFLDSQNIRYTYVSDRTKLNEIVVDNIIKGKVIGWSQGRFEWGPRALGNRSILADARRHEMKDIVNVKIKFREPFRPFAPSILVERASEYFDITNVECHHPARFMLYVVNVNEKMREKVPAITHVDGTGRLQAVYKDISPNYYSLIKAFDSATGVPLLLNTSFNLKGEPIVNTPANAYSTFSRSGIDMLVLENFIVKKEEK